MNMKLSMSVLEIAGVIITVVTLTASVIQSTQAFVIPGLGGVHEQPKAPAAISGENVYVTWWTNNTANNNEEIMFRASTDGGATFGDKINLSNTTDAESVDAEIAAEGNNVVVTWWERNQTVNEPVVRISNDGGQTFGETLRLGSNGTISNME
jgi:hypothetical protein